MSFPQVLGATRREALFGLTSFVVPLPWHIEAGDLLLIIFGQRRRFTPTTPGGWTVLFGPTNPSDTVQLTGYYRIADGSEADDSTVTINCSAAENGFAFAIRIGGNSGNPEAASASGTTGNSDPPNLAPSWGTEDTLWIACHATPRNEFASADPSGYGFVVREARTNAMVIVDPGSGSGTATGNNLTGEWARKEARAASDNPGVFAHTSDAWAAATIAVRGSVTPHEKVTVSWAD